MTKNIIAVITDPGKGGTFFSWTLHFLSGHIEYFNAKKNQVVPLPVNPLTKNNAHNFHPNHPMCRDTFDHTWTALTNKETTDFHILYFHVMHDNASEYALSQIVPAVKKIFLIENPKNNELYDCKYQARTFVSKFSDHSKFNQTWDEQHMDFLEHFFSDQLNRWPDLNFKNTWDHREFLALNVRPFDSSHISETFDKTINHYPINSQDLFTYFDQLLPDIFAFADIPLCKEKIPQWDIIFNQWRKIHCDRLQFSWYFNNIIEYIIKGYSLDLTRFNLDVVREAAIQHVLIFQYGLSIKSFGIEKFKNTQQIHELLEPAAYDELNHYNIIEKRYGLPT